MQRLRVRHRGLMASSEMRNNSAPFLRHDEGRKPLLEKLVKIYGPGDS